MLGRALRWTGRRAGVVIVLHRVDVRSGDPRRELVPAVGRELLVGHLRHLGKHYRIVDVAGILDEVRARRRGERFPVAVTLDDDLDSHARAAAPILVGEGVPATFFLGGGALGDEPAGPPWWEQVQLAMDDPALRGRIGEAVGIARPLGSGDVHAVAARVQAMSPAERDRLADRLRGWLAPDLARPPLSASGIRELSRAGLRIGFHTRRHDALVGLDDAALAAALRDGREALAVLAGTRLDSIAYPHGLADARVARAARDAGYELGVTTRPEPVRPDSDPLLLGRIEASPRSTARLALRIVATLALPRRRPLSGRSPS